MCWDVVMGERGDYDPPNPLPSPRESVVNESRPQPGTPPDAARMDPAFRELYTVIARLRAPDGCPWDRVQTLETIKPHTLEECCELLDAIDSGNDEHIVEELGDVLLQVLLDAQIGADEGRFTLLEVVERLTRKLVDRHPHVFGTAEADTPDDVVRTWDAAKQREKSARTSIFDGIPSALPQLARAEKLSKRAAKVGFDFPDREMLFDKLREEIDELQAEMHPDGPPPAVAASADGLVVLDSPVDEADRRDRIEAELGDVLFVVANVARRWGVNPEEALRRSNRKFQSRVEAVERRLAESGRSLGDASLAEMEAIYQEGKRADKT